MTENRMYAKHLEKELESKDLERQTAVLDLAYTNPQYEKFREPLHADFSSRVDALMVDQNHPVRKTELFQKEGVSGAVLIELLSAMDTVGMDPEDATQLLFGMQFAKEYMPADVYDKLIKNSLNKVKTKPKEKENM